MQSSGLPVGGYAAGGRPQMRLTVAGQQPAWSRAQRAGNVESATASPTSPLLFRLLPWVPSLAERLYV